MTALAPTAAFDVLLGSESRDVQTAYKLPELTAAPRLPVDLALVLMEIRKQLNWTTIAIQAALEEGIGDGLENPVHANLTAKEGRLHARVARDGASVDVSIVSNTPIQQFIHPEEFRALFENSKPFMPSMNDALWTPPGLDDPFMKENRNPDPEAVSPEIGWPKGFVMPEKYQRMGQEVNGDFYECDNLPTDSETLFRVLINAAQSTRVSIMGVFVANDSHNRGRASLAISESEMTLMTFPEQRAALATFFTCGNSNPRPAIDALHVAFDAKQTQVLGMVRGNDVPFFYQGDLEHGETSVVWEAEAQSLEKLSVKDVA